MFEGKSISSPKNQKISSLVVFVGTFCGIAFFFFKTGKAQMSTAQSRWCLKLPKFLLCNFLFLKCVPAGNLLGC